MKPCRQFEIDDLVLSDRLAEGGTLLRIADGVVEGPLSSIHRSCAHVDAAHFQPAHGVLEVFTFVTAEEVGGLDAFVARLVKDTADTQAWHTLFDEEDAHAIRNGYFSTKATSLQKAASPMLNFQGKQPIHKRMSSTSSIMPPAFSTWKTPCGNNW